MSTPLERIRKLTTLYVAEVQAADSPQKAREAVIKLTELQDALKEATPFRQKDDGKLSHLTAISLGFDSKLIDARLEIIKKALVKVKAIFQARHWQF